MNRYSPKTAGTPSATTIAQVTDILERSDSTWIGTPDPKGAYWAEVGWRKAGFTAKAGYDTARGHHVRISKGPTS